LPFEKLVEELQPERDLSYTPIFQILFVLQNAPKQAFKLSGLTLTPYEIDSQVSKFDLVLTVRQTEPSLTGRIAYDTDLFAQSTITKMCRHFERLLGSIAACPDARLSGLDMLLEEEKSLLERTSAIDEFEQALSI
jgi:non-ribosomal peptide synthetase component F